MHENSHLSRNISLYALGALVATFGLLHLVVNISGKTLLSSKLERVFNRSVTIRHLKTTLPFNIRIKDLEVEGLFRVQDVMAEGGAIDIFRRNFSLSNLNLNGLTANVEKPLKVAMPNAILMAKRIAASVGAADAKPDNLAALKVFLPSFSIKQLNIQNGKITFVDKSVSEKGINLTLKDLVVNAENLCIPIRESLVTSFDLQGTIPWKEGHEEGFLQVEGWLNLFRQAMEVNVKVEGIDGVYINPYYAQWADLEKARVEKAKLNFSSNIHGVSNKVIAACHLELTDIVFAPQLVEEEAEKTKKLATEVIDLFKAQDQGRMVLDFTVNTKMDNPEFGISIIKDALEEKIIQVKKESVIQDAVQIPGKMLEGLFKSVKNLTTAVVVGTISAGKEVGKTLGVSFKKDKTP